MGGPPYPHPNPVPGSNAIGTFVIGVSPIGTIPTFDVWTTMLNQYANSEVLTQLTTDFNEYVDQTENMDNFYDLVWNVDTAEQWGLDVWGRIVGVNRTLQVPPITTSYLGFEESDSWAGFGQAPFFSGGAVTSNFSLQDSDFRTLIFAKALSNISDGSTPSINQLLLNLFPGRGAAFIADNQNMSVTYTFHFALTPVELAILGQSNVLPNPVGSAVNILQV